MIVRRATRPDVAANVLLTSLGLVAAVSLFVAAVTLVMVMPLYRTGLRDHCVDLLLWVTRHPEIALVALPLGLLVVFALRALRRGHIQIRHTRQLMQTLGAVRPMPASVAVLALQLGIQADLDVVDHPVPAAFCHGSLRPRICLTVGLLALLDADELLAVLLHERHHFRRRDPGRLLLVRALLAGISFLPGSQVIYNRYLAVSELAADEAASEMPGGRLAMASSILKVTRAYRALLIDDAAISALSTVPGRVQTLMAPDFQPRWLPVGAVVRLTAGLALLVTGLAAPVALRGHPEPASLHRCGDENRPVAFGDLASAESAVSVA